MTNSTQSAFRVARLAVLNAAWVILLTANTRIVNAHFSTNVAMVAISQIFVSFGYFTLVKNIQNAGTWVDKISYCCGGAAGAVSGVILTWWVR